MSGHGTTTELLASLVEYHPKPFAPQHTSYISDTLSFSKHLEYINESKAPFSDSTKLISWDTENFDLNCNTNMCVDTIGRVF